MTLDDIKRVAKRLFDGQELIVTIVGKPGRAWRPLPREAQLRQSSGNLASS